MSALVESLRRALREAEMSNNDKSKAIRAALQALYPGRYVWVCDIYTDSGFVVFELETPATPTAGQSYGLYRIAFSIDAAGAVTLTGEPVEVQRRTTYVPEPEVTATEADTAELAGDIMPLAEAAVREDGTIAVKVIQPGWGSSGYYSPEMLERDAGVFRAGTKMYWNHQTAAEEKARPEGDLRDLAAEFTSDAAWNAQGPDGPGIYAEAKPFGPYRAAIAELAPHIGVSIRALGKAKNGEAEGRKGPVIEQLVSAKSVDFVTQAGAGGKVLELFEAARGRGPAIEEDVMSEKELNEARAEIARLKEADAERAKKDAERDAELARMREANLLRDAREFATAQLAKVELPDVTRGRLAESLAKNPPVRDGALDREGFAAAITEAAKAEATYLAEATGGGRVRGMGAPAPDAADTAARESAEKALGDVFKGFGLSESALSAAVAGRR